MAPGFMLYHDHVRSAARLTDAEFGRLIRALAVYSETESVPELQGPEIYLFDLFRADVDSNKAKYRQRCETNSKNSKGGRKGSKSEKEAEKASPDNEDPIQPTTDDDRQPSSDTEDPISPTTDNDRQRSSTNGCQWALNINKNKNKKKKKNIKECPPYSPPGGKNRLRQSSPWVRPRNRAHKQVFIASKAGDLFSVFHPEMTAGALPFIRLHGKRNRTQGV